MGEAMARRVYMSGRLFEAEEAVALGLLAKAVVPETLDEAIEAEVVPYLSCAPGAVAAAKAQLRALGPRIDAEVIDQSIAQLSERWASDEAQEGIAAFFEKRRPGWAQG
jgi:methylglutaconyl-CoA hydratase